MCLHSLSLTCHPLLFLGWNEPWLPRLATHLLLKGADLSETILILPGRRAGRRLLELLALRAQSQSERLLPPAIMTLEEAITTLFEIPDRPLAGKGVTRLAWREATLKLTSQELQAIQPTPYEAMPKKELVDRIASLAEGLASELGKAGFSIEEVLRQHTPFFPESADREEPRWKALAKAQKEYHKILSQWGYIDRISSLTGIFDHSRNERSTASRRVIVAGVVDFPPLFVSFFEKVNPEVIIIAPEEHAAGFDHFGKIVPWYWLKHPTVVPEEILIPCERSRDQAALVWEVIRDWTKKSSSSSITIVAPEAEALPFLHEAGADIGIPTRWAGGRFFQGSSLFLLLEALQKFLDRPLGTPPSLTAVADLLRHPIVAKKLDAALHISSELLLLELDHWEREHLSIFLEADHLKQFHKEETLGILLSELEKNFAFALKPEPLEKVLQQFRNLLFHLLEKENVRRGDPEGHFFLKCFEKLLLFLEELENLSFSVGLVWQGSELLSFLLEMLSKESIPELEQPQATEIIGWLEAAAEDMPALVLTSFHEGAVPTTPKSDPLLSERLRKKVGLGSAEDQLARDHYYLQLILRSRQNEGGVAILAPRYNGRDEPVRPSRLLLQGCSEKQLPQRVLALTQQHASGFRIQDSGKNDTFDNNTDKYPFLKIDDSFFSFYRRQHDSPLPCHLQPRTCNVSALRTYLKSPRLFYLQHILKLREVLESPSEINPQQFGVLMHRILAAFSAEPSLRAEKKEVVFCHWLEKTLERSFEWQFGKNPSPAVVSQKGEILRALKGFARAEAIHRAEGWQTIAVEGRGNGSSLLEEKVILDDGRSLFLQGRIDRLDWHPEKKRWLLLDYKTSHHQEWKKETPNRVHFQCRHGLIVWHDLQLPLYLKLALHLQAVQDSKLPLPSIENTNLCFFQLPIHPDAAGISEPFDSMMIEPAWEEAQRIIKLILDGNFKEPGTIDGTLSPTWKALCGMIA